MNWQLKKAGVQFTSTKYSSIEIPAGRDCVSVRNGKFSLDNLLIERSGDKQVQKMVDTGEQTSYDVEWRNDCEYILKSNDGGNELIYIKIVAVSANAYECYVMSKSKEQKTESNYKATIKIDH